MAKKEVAADAAEKPKVPTTVFAVDGKKFKFNVFEFILPGKNNNEPIKASEALKDGEILAKLVELGASVIEAIEPEEKEEA